MNFNLIRKPRRFIFKETCLTMNRKFRELGSQIGEAQKKLLGFNVDFIDEKGFKKYIDDEFSSLVQTFDDVCITGYFSEGIATIICDDLKGLKLNVRLISPALDISGRDKKNLVSLRKMQDTGIDIRINHRLHCRMFLCRSVEYKGLLILGSFDFNREGLSVERKDAGIRTTHPDLIESAYAYFNEIWEDKYDSKPLDEKYPE